MPRFIALAIVEVARLTDSCPTKPLLTLRLIAEGPTLFVVFEAIRNELGVIIEARRLVLIRVYHMTIILVNAGE